MYQSFCNDFIDQFSKEIHTYHAVKHKLEASEQVDEYSEYIQICEASIRDIRNAIKFKIPACDQLLPKNKDPIKTAAEFIKEANLPYPIIAIELESDTVDESQNLDMIVIAKQEGDFIKIYSHNLVKEWKLMEHDKGHGSEPIHILFNRIDFTANIVGFDSSRINEDKQASMCGWFLNVPTRAVLNLLCTLSCSNAHIDDHPLKPSKLKNDRRKQKGKLPFFEFKILTIDTEKTQTETTQKHGSHNSPRVHLRRGHIRKLPNKNVWVNACVVGDKSKGFIEKEYLVKS